MTLRTRVGDRRTSITAGLPLHQDEFDIVLDHGVWFVRLAEEARAVPLHLVDGIGDLMPDDRSQVVVADLATMSLNRRVQRDDGVATFVLAARQANVTHHANQAPPGTSA